jgi:hypothetical protein
MFEGEWEKVMWTDEKASGRRRNGDGISMKFLSIRPEVFLFCSLGQTHIGLFYRPGQKIFQNFSNLLYAKTM